MPSEKKVNTNFNSSEFIRDEKANASLTLGEVVVQTLSNHPDSRFHASIRKRTPYYTIAGIDTQGFEVWPTADVPTFQESSRSFLYSAPYKYWLIFANKSRRLYRE